MLVWNEKIKFFTLTKWYFEIRTPWWIEFIRISRNDRRWLHIFCHMRIVATAQLKSFHPSRLNLRVRKRERDGQKCFPLVSDGIDKGTSFWLCSYLKLCSGVLREFWLPSIQKPDKKEVTCFAEIPNEMVGWSVTSESLWCIVCFLCVFLSQINLQQI